MRVAFLEPAGAMGWRFTWRGAYLNYNWFDAVGPDGERGELELRRGLCDYEASIYNGGADKYRRECAPLVRVLTWSHSCDRPVSPELVRAFNAWRMASHLESLAFILAHPERYGAPWEWPHPSDMFAAPPLARTGGHYDGAAGAWRFNA